MFEAADVRKLLDSAGVQVKAMILLGVNCGLGNSDCANLRFRHVDLKRGWLDFPRPKTGIDRRCPLWPETIKALKLAIDERPTPKSAADQDHVFITKYGLRWVEDGSRNSPLSHEFGKLLKLLGLTQPGRNFYALRHVLETIGGATRDQPAVDAIMGHAPPANDMAAVYREGVDDKRLKAVTGHVRRWLFNSHRGRKSKPR